MSNGKTIAAQDLSLWRESRRLSTDFRFGRGTLPQNRRRALISLGADASNPATKGDTLWLTKNPSRFSSPSTAF